MKKVSSFADFENLKLSIKNVYRQHQQETPVQIRIAMATCGIASGASKIKDYFEKELAKRNIVADVIPTGCLGYCYAEPTVEVTLNNNESLIFGYVNEQKVEEIIDKYIIHKDKNISNILNRNFENVK